MYQAHLPLAWQGNLQRDELGRGKNYGNHHETESDPDLSRKKDALPNIAKGHRDWEQNKRNHSEKTKWHNAQFARQVVSKTRAMARSPFHTAVAGENMRQRMFHAEDGAHSSKTTKRMVGIRRAKCGVESKMNMMAMGARLSCNTTRRPAKAWSSWKCADTRSHNYHVECPDVGQQWLM